MTFSEAFVSIIVFLGLVAVIFAIGYMLYDAFYDVFFSGRKTPHPHSVMTVFVTFAILGISALSGIIVLITNIGI